jgi:predicted esterase
MKKSLQTANTLKVSTTEALAAIFTSFGADTEMYWHRGGHELGQDDIDAAQQWLSRKSAVWQNSKQAASPLG